jgi:hypothetical protein
MISFVNKRIIDIFIDNYGITKGIFVDNNLTSSVIFQKSVAVIGGRNINTGEIVTYSLVINNVKYTDIIISSSDKNIIIDNNLVTFNKEGEYNLTITYKTYIINLKIYVKDIVVEIS